MNGNVTILSHSFPHEVPVFASFPVARWNAIIFQIPLTYLNLVSPPPHLLRKARASPLPQSTSFYLNSKRMRKGEQLKFNLILDIEAQSRDALEPDTEYFKCNFYVSSDGNCGWYQGFTSLGKFIKYKYYDDSQVRFLRQSLKETISFLSENCGMEMSITAPLRASGTSFIEFFYLKLNKKITCLETLTRTTTSEHIFLSKFKIQND